MTNLKQHITSVTGVEDKQELVPHYEKRDDKPVWVSYEDGEEIVEPYNHQDDCFAELCASPNWCRCSQ